MNNLIRVEDTKLYLAKNYIGGKKSLGQCLDEVPTVNAIEIPDNATNEDVIKVIFSNVKTRDNSDDFITYTFDGIVGNMVEKAWWNALYKKERVDGSNNSR